MMIGGIAKRPDPYTAVPALPSWLIEPVWDQFAACCPPAPTPIPSAAADHASLIGS
jgi:hypothetical protein